MFGMLSGPAFRMSQTHLARSAIVHPWRPFFNPFAASALSSRFSPGESLPDLAASVPMPASVLSKVRIVGLGGMRFLGFGYQVFWLDTEARVLGGLLGVRLGDGLLVS